MFRSRLTAVPLTALLFLAAVGAAHAASAASPVAGAGSAAGDRGFFIVPVYDVRAIRTAADSGQPQIFEIIRPNGAPITLGRLNTSCSCVQLEAEKREYAQGERAFLILRNVRATPPDGRMYAFYVQIAAPIATTLRADTFVRSDRFQHAPPVRTVRRSPIYRKF